MTPPVVSTEEDVFDQSMQFYIEKYRQLTASDGENLPPAAACVVLLCAQLERTFPEIEDEDEEEDNQG